MQKRVSKLLNRCGYYRLLLCVTNRLKEMRKCYNMFMLCNTTIIREEH